jgi:hypothetical protein
LAEVAAAADVAAAPLPLPLLHAAMPATPAVPAMPASMVRRETGKPTSRGLGDVGRIERVMHASLCAKWLAGRGDSRQKPHATDHNLAGSPTSVNVRQVTLVSRYLSHADGHS